MSGQKINWWNSDAKSAPANYSNVDFYCKLRWDDNAKKSMGVSANSQQVRSRGAGMQVDNGAADVGAAPAGQPMQPMQPMQQQPYQPAQPSMGVQSAPVIQPFVVVPYSTPMQPIYHYSDGTLPIGDIDSNYMQAHGMPQNPMMNPMMGGMGYDDIYYNDQETVKKSKKVKKVKEGRCAVSAASIIIMILIALFGTVTLFIKPLLSLIGLEMETSFVAWNAGTITLFSSFETLIDVVMGKVAFDLKDTLLIVRGLLVIGSVFLALVFLTSLFTLRRRGTPIFGKIMAFLAFAAVAVAVVLCFLNKEYTVGITAYILAGIAFLVFFVSLFGRRRKSKKEINRGL